MTMPAALRLLLVPIGIALATKGLSYLGDEHERLTAENQSLADAIEQHRAELHATRTDPTTAAEPQDFPSEARPAQLETGNLPVRPRRPARRWLMLTAAVGAFAIGGYVVHRAQELANDREIDTAAHDYTAAAFRGEIDPHTMKPVDQADAVTA